MADKIIEDEMALYRKNITDNILSYMGENGYTYKETTAHIDMSQRRLSDIVNNHYVDITLATALCISKGIGIPVSRLIGEEKTKRWQENAWCPLESDRRELHAMVDTIKDKKEARRLKRLVSAFLETIPK